MYSDKNFDQIFSLDPDETKTKPAVDVNKSDLLGAILAGIPGVDGYPITKEAEDMLKPTQQPVPLADIPPQVDIKPKSQVTQKAPLQLEEMVIKAPQAVSKPAGPADKGIGLRGKPDVLEPMTTPAEPIPEPTPELPTPQIQPAAPISDVDQELLDAQAERKKMRMIQALLEAGGNLGQAISGGPVEKDMLKGFDDVVNEPMTSLKERRDAKKAKAAEQRAADEFKQNQEKHALTMDKLKMESEDEKSRRDPNSLYSQATREFQKQRLAMLAQASNGKIKFDPSVLDNMSAERMESAFGKPNMENLAGIVIQSDVQRENAAARREDIKLSREESRRRYEEGMELKKENKATRDQLENEKQVERYTNTVQKSDPFKESEKILGATAKVRELAKDAASKGGQSLAMLGPAVAKGLAGEVGVLTEQDVTRYTNNPSAIGSMVDTLNKVKAGKLSTVSYDNLMRLTDIMEKKALQARTLAYAKGATQLSRNSSLDYNKAYELLNPNHLPDQPAPTVQDLSAEQKSQYSAQEEAGIKAVMASNPGATREEVIKELKKVGKIK